MHNTKPSKFYHVGICLFDWLTDWPSSIFNGKNRLADLEQKLQYSESTLNKYFDKNKNKQRAHGYLRTSKHTSLKNIYKIWSNKRVEKTYQERRSYCCPMMQITKTGIWRFWLWFFKQSALNCLQKIVWC